MKKVIGCRYNWSGCSVVVERLSQHHDYQYYVRVSGLNGEVFATMAKTLAEAMKEGEKGACLIHPELSPQVSLCLETPSLSKVS